jgi:hypothetical protein
MARIRLRWRLWTMMVVVAVTGVAIEGEMMRRRRVRYQHRAFLHSIPEGIARQGLLSCDRLILEGRQLDEDRAKGPFIPFDSMGSPEGGFERLYAERARRIRERAAYYTAMRVKYERAAARPWLPVAPDPPAPD